MNALITGGTGAIGGAIARHLSDRYQVHAPTRTLMDVTDERSVMAYTAQFEEIDLLVLAHGSYGEIGRVEDTYIDLWKKAFEVNLFGSYRVIQAALRAMDERGRVIVMTGGGAGTSRPMPNISSYAGSKDGLLALVRALCEEDGAPMVNAISPGRVASKMNRTLIDSGRAGKHDAPIRALMETGAGAVPIENTLGLIDRLLQSKRSGCIFYAKDLF